MTDSGPGLAPSELSKLFLRFSQASSSTHTVFGGSGLGLYICKLISGLLGGRIEVESVKGEGSTFRFFIATMTPDLTQGDVGKAVEVKPILVPFPHVLVVEGASARDRTTAPPWAELTSPTGSSPPQTTSSTRGFCSGSSRRLECASPDLPLHALPPR